MQDMMMLPRAVKRNQPPWTGAWELSSQPGEPACQQTVACSALLLKPTSLVCPGASCPALRLRPLLDESLKKDEQASIGGSSR